ncbi:MAG TPA: TrbI/VirB10 family protein [Rhizomicrobium sp.]|jgi:type IV secretion system protein VirB10
MSDTDQTPDHRPVNELRLRGDRPPVTRLSRKMLIGLGATAAIAIAAATVWALHSGNGTPAQNLYTPPSKSPAPPLDKLPKDYTDTKPVPALGPPLPGDLGKPILNNGGTSGPNQITQAEQQRQQTLEAVRSSGLFIANAAPRQQADSQPAQAPATVPVVPTTSAPTSNDPTAAENMQDRKIAFANSTPDPETVSPARIQHPPSPYIVQAGWVINAALAQGVKSNLPDTIRAQVTQNVYDSPTGDYLLIPQGSMLKGQYDSQVSFGQTRVEVIWTRLIYPNGDSISLGHLPGGDAEGYAGLEDGVDEHWGSLFKAALLSTVLSVGSEVGTSDSENNLAQAIRQGASQSINQTGEQIVERNLNVQPTLTERFGLPVTLKMDHDVVLQPYQQP